MCVGVECGAVLGASRRELLRGELSVLMGAGAVDGGAVLGLLDEFDSLPLPWVALGACGSFERVVSEASVVGGGLGVRDVVREYFSRGQVERVLSAFYASEATGHRGSGMTFYARQVWAGVVRRVAERMVGVSLEDLCGSRAAGAALAGGAVAVQEARYSVVEGLLDAWAGSFSFNRSEGVLEGATSSLQAGAQRLMLRRFMPGVEAHCVLSIADRVTDVFLEAQYELSQEFLSRVGVPGVMVYRGLALRGGDVPWGVDSDALSIDNVGSLSSFSLSYEIAKRFAVEHEGGRGVVVSAWVPASRVLAVFGTGMADVAEQEVIVLSHPSDVLRARVVEASR